LEVPHERPRTPPPASLSSSTSGSKAVLDAWLAKANDPSLRADIGPVVAEFASLVNPDGAGSLSWRKQADHQRLHAH
jgi:hypothetical protein